MSNGEPSWYKGFAKFTGNTLTILMVVAVFFAGMVAGALIYERFWGNKGRIVGIGIDLYWDAALTDRIDGQEEYDWGDLEAGSTQPMSVWCHNNGTIPVYLTMYNQDFEPASIQQYFTITWDYNGVAIPVNGTRKLTFTLVVSPDTESVDLFRYTTYIVAEDARPGT